MQRSIDNILYAGMKHSYTVAVVGNPNVGKTALINMLAGSHLKIGNWPGVTVEKKEASLLYQGYRIRFIDLPGVYGLGSVTEDEVITNNFLHSKDYDIVLNVLDAHNLKLNMHLTSQVLELKKPMIVAINFWKEFKKYGNAFACGQFAFLLNIDVLAIDAIERKTKKNILDSIISAIHSKKIPKTFGVVGNDSERKSVIDNALLHIFERTKNRRMSVTDTIDRILLHPFFGLISFFMLFYFIFKWTFDGSAPFIDWIDGFFNVFIRAGAKEILTFVNAPSVIQSFVYDGLIAGIGTVMTFIPLMAFLYFFISLLEESGYIARVAFLLDKYMMMLGLPGKAFIPLLIGFGCNVPGVYATRTLEETDDRKIVATIMSFISCGAKLPIYILFTSLFFPRYAGQVAAGLYFLGMAIAIVWALILKKWMYRGQTDNLIIELPEYRFPTVLVVWNSVRLKIKSFVRRAGTVITAVVILIWALTNLPYSVNPDKSFLATVSKTASPLFVPLGWGTSWRATAAVVPGFLAKEAVVGALMTTYNVGGDTAAPTYTTITHALMDQGIALKDAAIQSGKMIATGVIPGVFEWEETKTPLTSSLQKDFTPLTALSFMVFNLLLMSCTAVMGAVKQEFGGKFLFLSLIITGSTAYVVSMFIYQFGRLLGF